MAETAAHSTIISRAKASSSTPRFAGIGPAVFGRPQHVLVKQVHAKTMWLRTRLRSRGLIGRLTRLRSINWLDVEAKSEESDHKILRRYSFRPSLYIYCPFDKAIRSWFKLHAIKFAYKDADINTHFVVPPCVKR